MSRKDKPDFTPQDLINFLLIQAPYPSNQSKRDQLFGRINRVEKTKKELFYTTVHTGLTTFMLKYHREAATLKDFFDQMAKEIK